MQTRYAKVGDAHVAYRTWGDGPVDLVYLMGEYLPVDALEEEPRYARSLNRLSSVARVIAFNRRGIGLSDNPQGPYTYEQAVEDLAAVQAHAGSERAVVMGSNISGPTAMQFAAEHPQRTSALILVNTTARFVEAEDYPIGIPASSFSTLADQTTNTDPGEFDFLTAFAPSVAADERFRAWWDSAGQRAASPARSREGWALLGTVDVRGVLGAITAPTLVVQRSGLPLAAQGRYVADHITGARYVELPGRDLPWWVGDTDPILNEIETFLARELGSMARARRMLATVLFVDVVSSTEQAAALGDLRWREVLDTYHDIFRRSIQRFGGNEIGTSGDGALATFPMPADAIRCARAMNESVGALDIDIRAGVHTGEIEILGDDVAGIGVHIAARVMSAAGPGEILVSRTVVDLVTGSGITFSERGEHDLKGVPGAWALYAVKP